MKFHKNWLPCGEGTAQAEGVSPIRRVFYEMIPKYQKISQLAKLRLKQRILSESYKRLFKISAQGYCQKKITSIS